MKCYFLKKLIEENIRDGVGEGELEEGAGKLQPSSHKSSEGNVH